MNEEQVQEQLQNALVTTFLANLAFLSEYDNPLYNRLVGLSESIEKGEYKERYYLEFIKECGDFDIFDSRTDEYLYKKKSKKFNNLAANIIKLDSKSEFFTLNNFYFKKHALEKTDYDNLNLDSSIDTVKVVLNEIQEFTNILEDNLLNVDKKNYKKINKFVFLGTLLGRHILSIVKKHNPKHFFVCEHNLEIFRLSLFVFDYTLLVENERTVVFSIMEDDINFNNNFKKFYTNAYKYNASMKYYATNYNSEDYFEKVFNSIIENSPIGFNYIMSLFKQAKDSFQRVNNYKILTLLKENKLKYFDDKQVLFLGAGPSLDENIDWIRENQDAFFIIAMGASYKKLIDNDIKIDLVTSLDASKIIYDKQFSDKKYIQKLGNIPLIAAIHTHYNVLEQFKKDNTYLYALDYPFFIDNISPKGFSIGEVTCAILQYLGVSKLYLLGIDFALNQETGETHISGSSSTSSKYDLNNFKSSLEKNTFDLNADIIKVKGNYKEEVLTTRQFYQSAMSLGKYLSGQTSLKVYNLSKGAAFIEGVSFLERDLVPVDITSEISKESLKEFLDDTSRIKMTKEEVELIKSEQFYLETFLVEFDKLKYFEINNFEHFEKTYLNLSEKLYSNIAFNSSFIKIIFSRYYSTIVPYLYYHFNDKFLKNEKKKMKELRKVFEIQLRRLIDFYIEFLNTIDKK